MHLPSILISIWFAPLVSVYAGSYTTQITRRTFEFIMFGDENHPFYQGPFTSQNERQQHFPFPMANQNHHNKGGRRGSQPKLLNKAEDPLRILYWSLYTTSIGIGNPPIESKALVDTSWSTSFVTSANCTSDPWDPQNYCIHPPYNSSTSSTYHANLTHSRVYYPISAGIEAAGSLSEDNLHVAGLEIEDHVFVEATDWHTDFLDMDRYFDTALGLALFPVTWGRDESNFTGPSPFMDMMEQGLLDKNFFTIKFPRTDTEKGELTLGAVPPEIRREEMIEIPLDDSKAYDGKDFYKFFTMNGWQIPVAGMSMESNGTTHSTRLSDKPQVAIIASSFPWIGLHHEEAKKANEAIGLTKAFDWVDCETRSNLPNWTVAFGEEEDQEITLTPWDYLIETYDNHGRLKCVSAFFDLDEVMDGGEDFIVLGGPFLNGLYSVFDADRKSISFANRPL